MLLLHRSIRPQILVSRACLLGRARCSLPQVQHRAVAAQRFVNQPPTPTVNCRSLRLRADSVLMDADKAEPNGNADAAPHEGAHDEPAAKRARTGTCVPEPLQALKVQSAHTGHYCLLLACCRICKTQPSSYALHALQMRTGRRRSKGTLSSSRKVAKARTRTISG